MKNEKQHKRRIKIIKPRFQLKLVGTFVGLAALAVLLQAVLLAHRLVQLSGDLPAGGPYLFDALPGLLGEILLFAFGLVLPLIFAVGVLVTHRIAGPVYRFEQHLRAVARGEDVGPCRIRSGDELVELCELINQAVERLRDDGAFVADLDRVLAEARQAEAEPLRSAG